MKSPTLVNKVISTPAEVNKPIHQALGCELPSAAAPRSDALLVCGASARSCGLRHARHFLPAVRLRLEAHTGKFPPVNVKSSPFLLLFRSQHLVCSPCKVGGFACGLVVVVATVLCAPRAFAGPVYLGSTAREGVSAEDRAAIDAALVRAFDKNGIPVLDATSAVDDTAAKALEDATTALSDARTAADANRWAAALTKTAEGFAAWERGPAFADDDKSKALGRDLLSLRALAAIEAKKKRPADEAARALIVLQPKYEPNKKKAPKPLLKLFAAVKASVKFTATIAVKSKNPGADVIVDGKQKGVTPMVVEGLATGVHYVAVKSPDGSRFTERVMVTKAGASVMATVGGKKQTAAKEVLALVEQPVGAQKLVEACTGVADDVVVAVLLPAGKNVEVISGRVVKGEVRSVNGVKIVPLENDRERATFALAEAISQGTQDKWLDTEKDRDTGELRPKLFSGVGSVTTDPSATAADDEGGGISPAVIAVAAIGAGVAVVALGGAAGFFGYREVRKDSGFTWSVDASKL